MLLAEALNSSWFERKLLAGWRYAPRADRSRKKLSTLIPWAQLPEAEKESVRIMARGLPKILGGTEPHQGP